MYGKRKGGRRGVGKRGRAKRIRCYSVSRGGIRL